jgi:MFS family permease
VRHEAAIAHDGSLLDAIAERVHARGPRAVVAAIAVIGAALVVAGYLDGEFDRPLNTTLWRTGLLPPVLVAYWLVARWTLRRAYANAIGAFHSLLADGRDFEHRVELATRRGRYDEWIAVALAIGIGLITIQPWALADTFGWIGAYRVAAVTAVFALLGLVCYEIVRRTRTLGQLHRYPLRLSIFDLSPLRPVARFAYSAAAAFVISIAVSELFLLAPGVPDDLVVRLLIAYAAILIIATALFLYVMWDSHQAIVALKQTELSRVRKLLAEAYRDGLTASMSAGLALEQRIESVSEWPYDIRTLRSLIVSYLVPGIAAAAQYFLGNRF